MPSVFSLKLHVFARSRWGQPILCWLILLLSAGVILAQAPTPIWKNYGIQLTPEEAAWLRENPRARLVADPTWAPFSSLDKENRYQGSDVDILRLTGQRLGITFVDVPAKSWEDALRILYSGGADVAISLAETPERSQHLLFSNPYFQFPEAIIARQNAPFFMSLDTNQPLKVAAPRGYSTTLRLIKDYPGLNIQQTALFPEALDRVADGRADVAVLNLAAANHYLREHTLANLKIVGFTDYHPDSCIGTRRELPLLASAIEKSLASIHPAERNVVFRRWVAADYTPGGFHWRQLLRALAPAVALAVIALAFALWHNRSLARELVERRRVEGELRVTRDRLVDLNAEKSRFMNMAAHDLKNPLNAVSGFSQLLAVGEPGVPDSVRRYADIIHEHAQRMHRLIVNLLDTQAIEEGLAKLDLKVLDLGELAAAVVANFQPTAAAKRITLSGPERGAAISVVANDDALTRVLENLLSNALKFTPQGGEVTIVIGAPPGATRARMTVADSGPGLSAADRERLFRPFERLSAQPTGAESSHGLGLFIARRLVEEQGGAIQVVPGPLCGACFGVELPLA